MTIKPKILFILHLPPPVHGAAMMGKYVKESKLINKQFECDFINLSTSESLTEIGKGGLKKYISLLKILFQVFRALLNKKYDLCYVTLTAKGAGYYKDFFIILFLKLFRKRIIYHFHNKGVEVNRNNRVKDFLYQLTFKNTKSILLSPNLYSDIAHYVDKNKVFFCPNGIPEEVVNNKVGSLDKESICKILFLSNMMIAKGVYVLSEACKILKEQQILFECHFVGDFSEISKVELERYIIDNNLLGRVFLHGKKIGQDKMKHYENSDLFVLPTYSECFPLVLIEAMQFGLPVVSTFEGGIPDIVVDSVTGFLVPKKNAEAMADKLKLLINNIELRMKMGEAGQQRYKELFTLEKFEQNISSILKSTISND